MLLLQLLEPYPGKTSKKLIKLYQIIKLYQVFTNHEITVAIINSESKEFSKKGSFQILTDEQKELRSIHKS